MEENKKSEEILVELLKIVAPGTAIREGLENILKAKTGALIIIGDSQEVMNLVDGGFFINEEYTASRLYELAKMDGAIVLSSDLKKILYANAQIIPNSTIPTKETGTRHRTAERTAKQTNEIVISISQRRNIITIFKGNFRYVIEDSSKVITKANQALQILEKYRKVLDTKISLLNEYEFNDTVTLDMVVTCIERSEQVMKIIAEIERSIYELGEDGRLVKMQLEELSTGLEEEELLIIKDYTAGKRKDVKKVLAEIKKINTEGITKSLAIAKCLGYQDFSDYQEVAVYPKGYRLLSKIPRVPSNIVDNLVKSFKSFQHVLAADIDKLDAVEGIGEVRARYIKQAMKRMQEQYMFDNVIL